jgi:lipopolysaccharide exporter
LQNRFQTEKRLGKFIVSKENYWLRSGIYTLLMQVFAMLFGLGGFMILTRTLDKAEFGTWALFLTLTGLIEVSRNALIQNALIKHLMSHDKAVHGKIHTASLVINLLLSLLSAGLLLLLASLIGHWLNAPGLVGLVQVYALTTLFLVPFSQSEFIQQANFDFKGVFWGHFTRLGGLFAFIALSYGLGWELKIQTLVWVHCLLALGGALVLGAFARPYFSFASQIDWQWVKKLFHFGKYVLGTGLSSMLLSNIDSWMLAAILGGTSITRGQQAVATYNAALRVTNLVQVPTNALSAMVFPQSAQRIETEGKSAAKYLYEKSVGVLLAMIIPGIIFVLLIPEYIIQWIAGEKYLDAVPVLQITMLYGLFMPFGRKFGIILDSMGKPSINFYFILFAAGLNVVLNYVFITRTQQVSGAAYGTLCTYVVTFIGSQIILRRELGVKTLRVFTYAWRFYPEMYRMGMGMIRKRLAVKGEEVVE